MGILLLLLVVVVVVVVMVLIDVILLGRRGRERLSRRLIRRRMIAKLYRRRRQSALERHKMWMWMWQRQSAKGREKTRLHVVFNSIDSMARSWVVGSEPVTTQVISHVGHEMIALNLEAGRLALLVLLKVALIVTELIQDGGRLGLEGVLCIGKTVHVGVSGIGQFICVHHRASHCAWLYCSKRVQKRGFRSCCCCVVGVFRGTPPPDDDEPLSRNFVAGTEPDEDTEEVVQTKDAFCPDCLVVRIGGNQTREEL